MKKNRLIEYNLNLYAASFERKEELLSSAYAEMDKIADERRSPSVPEKRTKKLRWAVFGGITAAAVAMLAIVILTVIASIPFSKKVTQYSLNSLTRQEISREAVISMNGTVVLNSAEGALNEKYYIYFKGKEPYVVAAKYRLQRGLGTDEVIVYMDLKGMLTDFDDDNNYITSGNIGRNYDHYINGEYYSYLYFEGKNADYYVSIMSPKTGGGSEYESRLFGNM